MNVTRPCHGPLTACRLDRTGPQNFDWHSAGVANCSATGRLAARAASRLTWWNGHGGWAVHTGLTPRGLAAVGVGTEIMRWPIVGVADADAAVTVIGVVSDLPLNEACTWYTPAFGNVYVTCA